MKGAVLRVAIGISVLLLLSIGGCLDQGKGTLSGAEVVCQRYEGKYMVPVNPQSRDLKTIEAWRKRLDKHAKEMGQGAMKCPSVENTSPRGLTYTYHTAWEDSAAGNVVLYYFAPIHNPKVYAGYGVHAVVGIRESRLKQLCVFPVPLE